MRGWSTPKEANPLPITGSLPARSSGRTNWQPYGRLSTLARRATPQRSSSAETARLRPGLTLFFVHLLSEPQVVKPDFNRGMRFFVLDGPRLPDLEKLGNRIGMENLDHSFCRGRPGRRLEGCQGKWKQ